MQLTATAIMKYNLLDMPGVCTVKTCFGILVGLVLQCLEEMMMTYRRDKVTGRFKSLDLSMCSLVLTSDKLHAVEHSAIGAAYVCQSPFALLPTDFSMPLRHSRVLDVYVTRFCATHREHCPGFCEGGTLAWPANCLQFQSCWGCRRPFLQSIDGSVKGKCAIICLADHRVKQRGDAGMGSQG